MTVVREETEENLLNVQTWNAGERRIWDETIDGQVPEKLTMGFCAGKQKKGLQRNALGSDLDSLNLKRYSNGKSSRQLEIAV